jgi:GxxExxY protein
MVELLFEDLSDAVRGAAMEVHRLLEPGFLEYVYRRALAREFELRGLSYERDFPLNITYKETPIGKYKADFVLDGKIILEVKATSSLVLRHEAQAIHYLAGTRLRLALLVNFGAQSLQIRRLIR